MLNPTLAANPGEGAKLATSPLYGSSPAHQQRRHYIVSLSDLQLKQRKKDSVMAAQALQAVIHSAVLTVTAGCYLLCHMVYHNRATPNFLQHEDWSIN